MKKILFALFLVVLVFVSTRKGEEKGRVLEKNEYKNLDKIVTDSFHFGCEATIMKSCNPKDIDSCRKFCFEFMSKNPKTLEFLKKKAKVLLDQQE